ncbi:hypothetical protein [Roseibium sp.]|uniref:hypothetical protein n=1 Tax=Roseibium sp. TaxID=1936156 RepID=UPI003B51634E
MSDRMILSQKINLHVSGMRGLYSYNQICKRQNIPKDIMLWRLRKKFKGKPLVAEPKNVLVYNGKKYTPGMLSEEIGISRGVLLDRWNAGLRGDDLIAKCASRMTPEETEELARDRHRRECRKHLYALFKHHPERREHAFRMVIKRELEPFDEASARKNATRLRDSAGFEIRSNGLELAA